MMTNPQFNDLLQKAIQEAKVGNRLLARMHLDEATDLDPQNEIGWIWLAWVEEKPSKALEFIRKALECNPNSELAKRGLQWTEALLNFELPALAAPAPASPKTVEPVSNPFPPVSPVETVPAAAPRPTLPPARTPTPAVNPVPAPAALGVSTAKSDLGGTGIAGDFSFSDEEETEAPFEDRTAQAPPPPPSVADVVPPAAAPATPPSGQKTVLVVDDSPTVCKIVSMTLEKKGLRVLSASDGVAAMSTIAEGKPNLILLDINMPRMDGYQLCRLIKGYEHTKHIPVVMLSGKDGFFDKVRGRLVGCTDYITKPFETDMLVQKVEQYLAERT